MDRQRHALEAALRDVTIGLRLKEELIRTLAHTNAEAEAAAAKYSARVAALQDEVDSLKQALVEQVYLQCHMLPDLLLLLLRWWSLTL